MRDSTSKTVMSVISRAKNGKLHHHKMLIQRFSDGTSMAHICRNGKDVRRIYVLTKRSFCLSFEASTSWKFCYNTVIIKSLARLFV